MEGATLPKGRGDGVTIGAHHLPLPGGAPASKKGGSLPPLSPLPCGAPTRRARRGRSGAAPSDSATLWLSNACTTWMSHPTLVRWTPIRRHRRDPQRRKSSIDPAPGASLRRFLVRVVELTHDGVEAAMAATPVPSLPLSSPCGTAPQHLLFAPPAPNQTAFPPITFKTPAMASHLTLM